MPLWQNTAASSALNCVRVWAQARTHAHICKDTIALLLFPLCPFLRREEKCNRKWLWRWETTTLILRFCDNITKSVDWPNICHVWRNKMIFSLELLPHGSLGFLLIWGVVVFRSAVRNGVTNVNTQLFFCPSSTERNVQHVVPVRPQWRKQLQQFIVKSCLLHRQLSLLRDPANS